MSREDRYRKFLESRDEFLLDRDIALQIDDLVEAQEIARDLVHVLDQHAVRGTSDLYHAMACCENYGD